MSDADEHLSIREVNELMMAHGFDPSDVREFAWQLVHQELEDDLPKPFAPLVRELGTRLRKLISRLEDNGVSKDVLRLVLKGVLADLINKQHDERKLAAEDKANNG